MPSKAGFKWNDGADRCILEFIQSRSNQFPGQTLWTSETKTAMMERLIASGSLPEQAAALTVPKVEYHIRKLVTELSGDRLNIGHLLQGGILLLEDSALLKFYGPAYVNDMRMQANNTANAPPQGVGGQKSGPEGGLDGRRVMDSLANLGPSTKPEFGLNNDNFEKRRLASIGDTTVSESDPSSNSPDRFVSDEDSDVSELSDSLLSKHTSKRKRTVDDDDASAQRAFKQMKSSNQKDRVRATSTRTVGRPQKTTKMVSHAADSSSSERHPQQDVNGMREADGEKTQSVPAQTTIEEGQPPAPDHLGDEMQGFEDPQPRIQKLKSGDNLFDAGRKPQVEKVMQTLYDAIDTAVRDLIDALDMDESQPVHLNSKLNFPPILGRLLCRITSEGSYIDRPQASGLFSTKSQLRYNLKYFLQSLIAAAVHEYCFLPAPEGRDVLLDLDNGQGYLRTALENILNPSDFLRAELEIKREFIKKDFEPSIVRQAANLATEFDSIMMYILPRPTNSMCLTHTFNSIKSFAPADNIPTDGHFPASVKQWQRNWLRDLSKIFASALNWRADGVAAGNVEYMFQFPTHNSRYLRWPVDLNEHARDIDKDPEARVVLGLMPRVLVKMREYIDRDLPGEEFKVASDGMVLVGS